MRKYLPIIIVLSVILIILAIVAVVVVSTIGKTLNEKNSLTTQEFISKVESMGFTTTDVKSQFSTYDYVKTATLAHEKDRKYKIEFYTLDSEEGAEYFFAINKVKFEEIEATVKSKSKVNGKNHSKFTFSANGKYMVISRVGTTCMYVNADIDYKEEINNLLKQLGY